ncbi:MAG: hypothetical protein D6766_11260 [Verrucomicrobia bacterium]|nr:MAG: hypothetical protein D6766_11260 [Verrucomicrobiota bacterium]
MEPTHESFEKLRRLLELKRHELPPPGFHDRLARSIRRRLESETAPAKASPWALWTAWWRRLGWEAALSVALLSVLAALYGLIWFQGKPGSPGNAPAPMLTDVAAPENGVASNHTAGAVAVASNLPPALEGLARETSRPGRTSGPPPGLFAPGAGLNPTPASFRLDGPAALAPERGSNAIGSNANLRPLPPR